MPSFLAQQLWVSFLGIVLASGSCLAWASDEPPLAHQESRLVNLGIEIEILAKRLKRLMPYFVDAPEPQGKAYTRQDANRMLDSSLEYYAWKPSAPEVFTRFAGGHAGYADNGDQLIELRIREPFWQPAQALEAMRAVVAEVGATDVIYRTILIDDLKEGIEYHLHLSFKGEAGVSAARTRRRLRVLNRLYTMEYLALGPDRNAALTVSMESYIDDIRKRGLLRYLEGNHFELRWHHASPDVMVAKTIRYMLMSDADFEANVRSRERALLVANPDIPFRMRTKGSSSASFFSAFFSVEMSPLANLPPALLERVVRAGEGHKSFDDFRRECMSLNRPLADIKLNAERIEARMGTQNRAQLSDDWNFALSFEKHFRPGVRERLVLAALSLARREGAQADFLAFYKFLDATGMIDHIDASVELKKALDSIVLRRIHLRGGEELMRNLLIEHYDARQIMGPERTLSHAQRMLRNFLDPDFYNMYQLDFIDEYTREIDSETWRNRFLPALTKIALGHFKANARAAKMIASHPHTPEESLIRFLPLVRAEAESGHIGILVANEFAQGLEQRGYEFERLPSDLHEWLLTADYSNQSNASAALAKRLRSLLISSSGADCALGTATRVLRTLSLN